MVHARDPQKAFSKELTLFRDFSLPACFIYKLHNMRNSSRNKLIIFHQFLERIVGEGLFRGCFSNICELGSLCRDSN